MAEPVVFKNSRLGEIEVDQNKLLTFPAGMLGFSALRRFALLPHRPGTPFYWLVAVDAEDVAFVVVNPEKFFDSYCPSPTKDQLAPLNLQEDAEVSLGMLVVVSFHGGSPTANLRAPLLLDLEQRLGVQAVQMNKSFDTRAPLFSGRVGKSE
jgi:flagellar assembly factor FliW